MMKTILTEAAKHVIANQVGSRFDIKLGFSLFKDKRISFWHKLFALGLGGAATAICILLEIPLEVIVTTFLGLFGVALDIVADGAEAVVVTSLVGCLSLPFIAPKETVHEIMAERKGLISATSLGSSSIK